MSKKILADGVGYDPQKKLYYINCYAWYHTESYKKENKVVIKSGISKKDVYGAYEEAVPVRGRQDPVETLFGYETDFKYFPKDITLKQANNIAWKMDFFFKDEMKDSKRVYKENSGYQKTGTEFYMFSSLDEAKIYLYNKWNELFNEHLENTTGKKIIFKNKEIPYRGSQEEDLKIINEYLNINDKGTATFCTGYGKGFIIYKGGVRDIDKAKNSHQIIHGTHTIAATKQLSVKSAQYCQGTIFEKDIERICICSDTRQYTQQKFYGIKVIKATDKNLKKLIEQRLLSDQRTFWFINKKSNKKFKKIFEEVKKKIKYDQPIFAFLDEIHHLIGNKGSDATSFVEHPTQIYQLGLTATRKNRSGDFGSGDENKMMIYNDDKIYWGQEIIEKTLWDGVLSKQISPLEFKLITIDNDNVLLNQIRRNATITTLLNQNSEISSDNIRGKLLECLSALVKATCDDKIHHPMIFTRTINSIEDIAKILEELQKEGYISKKFKIIRTKTNREKDLEFFNLQKYAIVIGTDWMCTALDVPNTDSIFFTYEPKSIIKIVQSIGRGVRFIPNKILKIYVSINVAGRRVPQILKVLNNLLMGKSQHETATNTLFDEDVIPIIGSLDRDPITFTLDGDVPPTATLKRFWNNITSNLNIVKLSTITGETKDIMNYENFKNWAYPFKWNKKEDFFKYINDPKNVYKIPPSIPRNPREYYIKKNINFAWPDALGYKPGFFGFEQDINVIKKFCIENMITTNKMYVDWHDKDKLPNSFPRNLYNSYKEYTSWQEFIGKKDYSELLNCKNDKEARKKYNATIQSLYKTKDKKLIEKYTGHFEKLRVKGFTDDMLNSFFESLSEDNYPDHNNEKMCKIKGLVYDKNHNGMYRAIFNRGKDKWYNKILKKWKDKVPMKFLKEEDKLKKVKKEIKLCENYTEWFVNYKSSHQKILEKTKQLHLLDILEKQHNHNHTEEDVTKLLKKYNGKYFNDFRNDYNAEYCWLIDRKELKDKLFKQCGLIEDPRWIKRKQKK